MPDIGEYLASLGRPMVNALFVLAAPLTDEVKKQLFDEFDGPNIDCRHDPHHWWSDWTPEDKPSSHAEHGPDGSIKVRGVDFTEGRVGTYLQISGDGKLVRVDADWNYWRIKAILDKNKVSYAVDDDYEWPRTVSPETIKYLTKRAKQDSTTPPRDPEKQKHPPRKGERSNREV